MQVFQIALVAAMLGAAPEAPSKPVRLVHLSDLHVSQATANRPPRFFGDPLVNDLVHSRAILRAAVDQINSRLRPDLVVITGDLADRGDDLESLRRVKVELDRLQCPYYPVMGDHDRPEAFERVFPGRQNYAFDRGTWRFVALDAHRGRLEPATLGWLKQELDSSAGRRTALLIHRPLEIDPVAALLAARVYRVQLTLQNAEDVRQFLRGYPSVRLVLAGHTHVAWEHQSDAGKGDKYRTLVAPALVVTPHCLRLVELEGDKVTSRLEEISPATMPD